MNMTQSIGKLPYSVSLRNQEDRHCLNVSMILRAVAEFEQTEFFAAIRPAAAAILLSGIDEGISYLEGQISQNIKATTLWGLLNKLIFEDLCAQKAR